MLALDEISMYLKEGPRKESSIETSKYDGQELQKASTRRNPRSACMVERELMR